MQMTGPLTVRNLTSSVVLLKRIERFEDPQTLQSKNSAFQFSSNTPTFLPPTSPELGEHAQTFKHEELDLNLAPFESCTLKAQGSHRDDGEQRSTIPATITLRLTIEIPNGERYRIDANPSHTQKSSQEFTPLITNPSTSYTALYHPAQEQSAHLTIHSNHLQDYSIWMSKLPDSLPLSAISIPGTHNSHTHYRALPSVRCQTAAIESQLENGIRFLDIRVQPAHATDISKKDLYLVHGAFPISLTGTKYLEPVLRACYDFIAAHPSETVLISLKREGVGNSTDEHLARILKQHYFAPNKEKWFLDDKLPYLGQARGKLVLLRRYNIFKPQPTHEPPTTTFGLDATHWPNNRPHFLSPHLLSAQDFCEIQVPSLIPQKLVHCTAHLARAAASTAFIPGVNTDPHNPIPQGPLHLNFLSGSNFFRRGCWPDRIAERLNRGVERWVVGALGLEEGSEGMGKDGEDGRGRTDGEGQYVVRRRAKCGDGGTGVVVMDYVGEGGDWDLVRLIVGLNIGVLLKCQGHINSFVDGEVER